MSGLDPVKHVRFQGLRKFNQLAGVRVCRSSGIIIFHRVALGPAGIKIIRVRLALGSENQRQGLQCAA